MDKKDCSKCKGRCCKYVAVEIDKPETKSDFEDVRWYVSHKNINIFVDEDGDWYIEFMTPCEFLGEANKCMNYENRPEICREYDQDECTFHNDYSEELTFTNLEEIDEYIQGKFG
ncbi:YkgJ family cysteine cluster protein [Nanoarchaeota archaeon]